MFNDGIVAPSEVVVSSPTLGEEKENESTRPRRPSAGPWQRTTGRQRQADRPRSSSRAAQIICPGLQKQYGAELGAVEDAYPSTTYWQQEGGLWLLTESTILRGLGKKATFLTFVPYDYRSPTKSWGFWTTPVYVQWIGPRHTNFPDGSICAFEPRDQTWTVGDSIVKLLDLFTVWALRHLHLEVLGRWPGYQSVPHPYERLTELNDNEFCGCERSDKYYADCCKQIDLERDRFADEYDFLLKFTNGGLRAPPKAISNLIRHRTEPPPIVELLSQDSF